MRENNIFKNFTYQLLYQVVTLVIPIVVSPYVTRKLGSNSLGIYTYVNSISYFFVVFSMLGISRYGQRVIAISRRNETELRKTFWSLFFIHAVFSLLILIVYILFIIFIVNENKLMYLTQIVYVFSAVFDVTWLFYGLEDFKNVVIKNTVVKIVECILIFTFINNENDVYNYSLIVAFGLFFGQTIMIPRAIRIVKPIRFSINEAAEHIKPLFVFFISVLASTLYTSFDKTLLGLLSTKNNVAYYEFANRLISVPRTIVTIIGTVLFPRICKMVANGENDKQSEYINYSFLLTSFISFSSIFGLLFVAKDFSIIYYGIDFATSGLVMMWLSPIIFIVGVGDVIRTQYMIPNHMDREFTISIVISAILNLLVSSIAIPYIDIGGAVIGTLTAELFGLCFQLYVCRNVIKISQLFTCSVPFIIIGLLMYVFLLLIYNNAKINTFVALFSQVGVGAIIYIVLTIVYLLMFRKDIYNKIFTNILKKYK